MSGTDKLMVCGMRFYGYHGVHATEKDEGQWFEVDVAIWGDFAKAARNDDIHATLDYSKLYEIVRKVVEGSAVNLVETLAERISQQILALPLSRKVRVTVRKPEAPLGGPFDYAGVEIERYRDGE